MTTTSICRYVRTPRGRCASATEQSTPAALDSRVIRGEVSRTISMTMSDNMRFTPDRIEVRNGETIRFVLQNEGQLRHELVLGEPEALRRHAAMMQMMPDMQHSGPNMASLAPGERGELIWKFTRTGTVTFACLQSGHLEAGHARCGRSSVRRSCGRRSIRIPSVADDHPLPVLALEHRSVFPGVHRRTRLVGDLVGPPLPCEIARRPDVARRAVLVRESRGCGRREVLHVVLADRSLAPRSWRTRSAEHGILGVERSDSRAIAGVEGLEPRDVDGPDCGLVRGRIRCRRRSLGTGRQRSEARREDYQLPES